jgi:acyl carrier protein
VIPGDVADRIEMFIRERFDVGEKDARFSRRVHLFEEGYIDSIGVAELVEFLEEEFEIRLPEQALMSDEFSTIDGIVQIVERTLTPVSRTSS